jgi:hypothetical protein
MVGPFLPELSAASVSYTYSGSIVSVSTAAMTATGVVVGDTITGSFTYDPTQGGSGGLYTFTGSTTKAHNFALKIFNSSGGQQFSDSFTGNTSPPADYYAIQLTFHTPANNGTTLDLMGDTVYKQGLGVTGPGPPPAYDLTLHNPTNAGGYSATNLPLPNATLITNFVKATGVLNWDPEGQHFKAILHDFRQTVPEPSSRVLAILTIMTCTVVYLVSRRKRVGDFRSGRHAPLPHH